MIDFPNHSRSYDPTRRAVRFWGHDSAIEASFFIDEDALMRIQPDTHLDESGFLSAFDSNRDLICAAAARVYVRGSRGSYDLVAANFWSNGLRFSASHCSPCDNTASIDSRFSKPASAFLLPRRFATENGFDLGDYSNGEIVSDWWGLRTNCSRTTTPTSHSGESP
jgi:Protein of unknown function (DUF1488).